MVTQIMSRSERRMEKKQALILLVLILAVSLASFVLGVMVGRGSGRPAAAQAPPPERLPVSRPEAPQAAQTPAPGTGETPPGSDHLTFYDALPKGEQPPLGSGINLPPEETAPKTPPPARSAKLPAAPPAAGPKAPAPAPLAAGASPASAPAAAVAGQAAPVSPDKAAAEIRKAELARQAADARKAEAARAPEPPPKAASPAGGAFVIQVASFPDAAEARKMRDRLASRGFGASVEQADLGSKGTWHRVVVGPYDSDQSAAAAASRLKAQEKVSALVRRR